MVKKSSTPKTTSKTEKETPAAPAFSPEELKSELKSYVDARIDELVIDRIDAANKKLLREKSRKIWFRNILIVILLALSLFLTSLLYKEGFFNPIFYRETESLSAESSSATFSDKSTGTSISVSGKSSEKSAEELKKEAQKSLKEKYASLLKPFKIASDSSYLSDLKSGDLTEKLKFYFTLASLDFDTLETEDESSLISVADFKVAYEKLFYGTFEPESFDFNGNKIRYLSKLNSFVSTSALKTFEDSLNLEIEKIEETEEKVIIKTKNHLTFAFKNSKLLSLEKSE